MTTSPTVTMPAPPTTAATYHRAPPQPPSPAPLQGPPPLELEHCTPRCTPPHEVTSFFSLADKQHFYFYLFTEG